LGGTTWGRAGADGASWRPTTQATLPSADQAAEIARLQRENERLRMERDILKKSIAIFAGTRT
jgi:transposase